MNDLNIEHVDLNLLKALQSLLLECHVGRAAKRMHVSQSGMSHTLARLRETFEDPLFVRTGKGLEPTPRAVEISHKLPNILRDINALLEPEHFDPSNIQTRFPLQTHNFISARYLANFFRQMHKVAPGLVFETYALTESSYNQLEMGEVDLIISGGFLAPTHLRQRRIIEEEMVCLVDRDHPAIASWDIEHFLSYPHIRNTLLSNRVDSLTQALRNQNHPPRKFGFYSDDMLTQAVVLKDSELIAMLPRSLAESESKQHGHMIMPCPLELPKISIKAIWHERNQNNPLHQWLREQLATIVR